MSIDNKSFKEEQLKRIKLIDDVFKLVKEKEAKNIDFRFTDSLGEWRQFTIPVIQLERDIFFEGYNIDGSLICNWKNIDDSDLTVIPDPATARIDTIMDPITVILICDLYDSKEKKPFTLDPRNIAKKSINYLKETGIADNIYIGAESKFFIFDSNKFVSNEFKDKSGAENKIKIYSDCDRSGYLFTPPDDEYYFIREQIVQKLLKAEIEVERHHCESAFAGQNEISFRYSSLIESADIFMIFKNIVKNVAKSFGKTATFVSKPAFDNLDNTLHVHVSLWKNGENIMNGDKYAGLSELALKFISGILYHIPSLLAFTNPTNDSYNRFIVNKQRMIELSYSVSNRKSAIRIPITSNLKRKRIEFRIPDANANPYLAFSAILMAGIDGVVNNFKIGNQLEVNNDVKPDYNQNINVKIPATLEKAIENLRKDNEYLKAGNVFSEEMINYWINYRTKNL